MPLSDKDFVAVLDSWHHGGDEKVWHLLLPHATPAELQEAHSRCREIFGVAYYLAEDVMAGVISEDEGKEELGRRYPFLTGERLSREWWNGLHSARK